MINDAFIQNLNKGRGAGFELYIASQTIADFVAKMGDPAMRALRRHQHHHCAAHQGPRHPQVRLLPVRRDALHQKPAAATRRQPYTLREPRFRRHHQPEQQRKDLQVWSAKITLASYPTCTSSPPSPAASPSRPHSNNAHHRSRRRGRCRRNSSDCSSSVRRLPPASASTASASTAAQSLSSVIVAPY